MYTWLYIREKFKQTEVFKRLRRLGYELALDEAVNDGWRWMQVVCRKSGEVFTFEITQETPLGRLGFVPLNDLECLGPYEPINWTLFKSALSPRV